MKRSLIAILILIAIGAFAAFELNGIPTAMAAPPSNSALKAVGDEGAVILRWVWPQDTISPPGYNIYRREQGAEKWKLLTSRPITKVSDRREAKDTLGAEAFQKYEVLLFPELPVEKPKESDRDSSRLEQLWGITMLSADMHPEVANLLGVRYVDRTAKKGRVYVYGLTMVEKGKEQFVAISQPVNPKKPFIPPPKGLAGEAGDAKVFLKWTRELRFSGYDVYRRSKTREDFVKINKAPVIIVETFDQEGISQFPEWMYVDRDVQNGMAYTYMIKGRDPYGRFSSFSGPVEFTPVDLTPPLPPGGFCTEVKNNTVTLTWQKPLDPDLQGYNLYRSRNYKSGFEKITAASLPPDKLRYLDQGLNLGTSYWYYATAVDSSGNESGPSYTALARVMDRLPPGRPEKLQGKAEPGKALLSWDANKEKDLAGYRVYRSMDKDAEPYQLLNQKPLDDLSIVDEFPETASAAPFYFKVTAVDTSGNESDFSETVKVHLPDVTPPDVPVFRDYHVKEGLIALSWYPNIENDLAGYNIYRRLAHEGNSETKLNENPLSPDTLNYSDGSGLIPGKRYAYSLRAVDRSGNLSLPSRSMSASTYDKTPPQPPADLYAEMLEEKKAVLLEWKMPPDKDLKGVIVYRSSSEQGPYRPITRMIQEPGYTDRNVQEGRQYFYKMVALDQSNNQSETSKAVRIYFGQPD